MTPSASPAATTFGPLDAEVDAVMHAAQVLVAVVAASVSAVESVVTVTQLRILMLVATRQSMNLSAVADALHVHASNASRACDRLVKDKLLERRDSITDRRNLVLELSPQGRNLVESVIESRRDAMRNILDNMSGKDRARLAPVLSAFAIAAGEHPYRDTATPIWGD